MAELFDDVTEQLKEHGLTYKWLIERLAECGCYVDKVSISKWAHGVQVYDKAKEAHDLALKILEKYKNGFAEKVSDL